VVHCAGVLQKTGRGRLRNVVLMGMGEPLHNYDSVMNALEIISDSRGLNIGSAHITVSTVGHVPGILRMAEENRPFNLAISLHGASDAVRESLVPAGKRWPLDELLDACRFYGKKSGRRIFFEWTLVSGKNDTLDQAEKLAEKISGIDAHVNLIQLNATASFHGAPPSENMARSFQRTLKESGIPATMRQGRGGDIAASCGQLRLRTDSSTDTVRKYPQQN